MDEYKQTTFMTENDGLASRVELFMRLFSGRTDMYAQRYYNKYSHKTGYSVVCRNEWQENVCAKKKKKPCALCQNKAFMTLTPGVITSHITRKDDTGVCSIAIFQNKSSSVSFTMVRLQNKDWLNTAIQLQIEADAYRIPLYIERDSEGTGRCWIFYEQEIPASVARKIGAWLITKARQKDHALPMSLYDNVYPTHDKPLSLQCGFGTPIPLPMQGWAMERKNSVFIDNQGNMFDDQWLYLSMIVTMDMESVHALNERIGTHSTGFLLPEYGPFAYDIMTDEQRMKAERYVSVLPRLFTHPMAQYPAEIRISYENEIHVPKAGFSEYALDVLLRIGAYNNPQYEDAAMRGLSLMNISRIIETARETDDEIILPRGCKPLLEKLFNGHIRVEWVDERYRGVPIRVEFNGELRDEQIPAAEAMCDEDTGILNVPTAFGKTVTAAYIISQRKVNTLILVHTNSLIKQWVKALEQFLIIDEPMPTKADKKGKERPYASHIGVLGGGKSTLHGIIDVATIQSVTSMGSDICTQYGYVICDECHHISASTFMANLRACSSKYVNGLTATATRPDGHQNSIYLQCGRIAYSLDAAEQAKAHHDFTHKLIPRFMNTRIVVEPETPYNDILSALIKDTERNETIAEDAVRLVNNGRTPILLTERREHAEQLYNMVIEKVGLESVYKLTGDDTAKEKDKKIELLMAHPKDKPLIVIATGKYVGEGFDAPRLDTLLLTMPIKWKGTVAQYAGRLHRNYEGKTEVQILDYVDLAVSVLAGMYMKRLATYIGIGYVICSGIENTETPCSLFDDKSVYAELLNDITQARKEIVMLCPRISKERVARYTTVLATAAQRGVKIVLVTKPVVFYKKETRAEIADAFDALRIANVRISERPDAPITGMLIDRRIVYYGTVAYLTTTEAPCYCIRSESYALCKDILTAYK